MEARTEAVTGLTQMEAFETVLSTTSFRYLINVPLKKRKVLNVPLKKKKA